MSDSNVLIFPIAHASAQVSPETILEGAIESDLDLAIVVGVTKEGKPYIASTEGYLPDVLWRLAQAQRLLLELED
jgi:hypothetical protein